MGRVNVYPCAIEGCPSPRSAKGYCTKHYLRFKKTGDPLTEPTAGRALDGAQFGRLTVVGPPEWRANPHGKRMRMELCECTCGTRKRFYRGNLISGKSTSCGCLTRERSAAAHRQMRVESGYHRAHDHVYADWGPAKAHWCACGEQAAHWAYDHKDPNEKCERGLLYSNDTSHYIPMCGRCHARFDADYRAAMKR